MELWSSCFNNSANPNYLLKPTSDQTKHLNQTLTNHTNQAIMINTIIAFTITIYQAQSEINLCVYNEQESDCAEQAQAVGCDRFVPKSTVSISPVLQSLLSVVVQESKCTIIPLEDTCPLSSSFVWDYVFDPFLPITAETALTTTQMQQIFIAADYSKHPVILPAITKKICIGLEDSANDKNWDWSFILAHFYAWIRNESGFSIDRRFEILPYLYQACDGDLFSLIKQQEYHQMINEQNIEQLTTILKYYESGAFDTLDLYNIREGAGAARVKFVPIMVYLVRESRHEVLKLFVKPEWYRIFACLSRTELRALAQDEEPPLGKSKPFSASDSYGARPLGIAIEHWNDDAIELMMNSIYGKEICIDLKGPWPPGLSEKLAEHDKHISAESLPYFQIALHQFARTKKFNKVMNLLTKHKSPGDTQKLFDDETAQIIMEVNGISWPKPQQEQRQEQMPGLISDTSGKEGKAAREEEEETTKIKKLFTP